MRNVFIIFLLIFASACGSDDEGGTTNNNIPPNPPSLITPSNNSTIVTQIVDERVYFEWTNATDPDNDIIGYRIWVDSDPNFSNPFHHFAGTTNTTSYLSPNKQYYWRVTTSDSNGNVSNNSQTWSFYLEDGLAPTPPQLIFPLHETECSNDNLTFEWNASTDPSGNSIEYKLHISLSPSFDSDVDIYTTSNTSYNVGLPQSTALYWKVEAFNGANSSFSEARSLYTQGDGVSNTIPQLQYLYPEDGATISDQLPLLQWQASDNETSDSNLSYKVYFSEVGQDLVLIEDNAGISSHEVSGLNSGTTYQWSIWVTDEDEATNVGDVWRFSIE